MATIDTTQQTRGKWVADWELPDELIDELIDRRSGLASDNFPVGSEWVRLMMSPYEAETLDEETVLGPDEVTREAVSFASAPVVIALTDEQAGQFLRFRRRGASPQ
ncbi:MAG: hypothetical protein ACLPUT_10595 [Solirubrobacteraceae bacterium]